MSIGELGEFIRDIGFPCAIALLMFWNNRQMTKMVDEYFRMIFSAVHNIEGGNKNGNEGN